MCFDVLIFSENSELDDIVWFILRFFLSSLVCIYAFKIQIQCSLIHDLFIVFNRGLLLMDFMVLW